jgi:putative transport protein
MEQIFPVAIIGINAGTTLLFQLTGAVASEIFLLGLVACTIPSLLV